MVRHVPMLALAAGALACASAPTPPVASAPPPEVPATAAPTAPAPAPAELSIRPAVDSGLRFAVSPVEAQIAVDGNPVGTVSELAAQGGLLRLAPGIYQVSLKAPGFVTWRAEVALRAGTETIRVDLARKP